MEALVSTGRLTPELRDYLEIGYISLADCLNDEIVTLLREYRRAGEELAQDRRQAREARDSGAWRRSSGQSRMAGQVARAMSEEGDRLHEEFRSWQRGGVTEIAE